MSASISLAWTPFWHMRKPGSSPVKMSQAFHDPSIYFNFLYFHRKVNTFKTPEMCFYVDSDVWAGCFTIIFAGSFHCFKAVSCWIPFCENVTGIPEPFDQLQSRMRKVNVFTGSYGNLLSVIFRAESLDWKLSFARCQSSVPFILELQYQFLIWCKISRTFEMLCSQLVVCLTNCKFYNLNFLSVRFLKGCSKWNVQEKILLVLWSFIQWKCMLINLVNVFISNVKFDSFYWTFHTCLTRG